jgi:paraquat-inducible protein B
VNATLASARTVADDLAAPEVASSLRAALADAAAAAANVSTASEDLPALIDNLQALSARASALPLEDLVTSGTRVLDTADTFLASEGVESVPPKLAAALEELRAILAELREGGAVANVNATLASADRAATAVTEAAADLPALVAELSRVAARADTALSTVGPNSDINRDTLLLLREVREAARSVNALVTALERRPNSVLFGRGRCALFCSPLRWPSPHVAATPPTTCFRRPAPPPGRGRPAQSRWPTSRCRAMRAPSRSPR